MITNLTKNYCTQMYRNLVALKPFSETDFSRMEFYDREHRGPGFYRFEIKIHILYFDTRNRDVVQYADEAWIEESELQAWIDNPYRQIAKMEYYRSI